ncbi:hypothetical protein BpHYR1_023446 [Brachionus plicatilis]|uniref:Uncharacterized protein n=1 Tax=Brachionus plicatilis TaxID=10195 RepID=A0A3M7Q6V4_BRAPC|nr:hypothetical protein BpHYR1_023446 [Brachionus plicatilis]
MDDFFKINYLMIAPKLGHHGVKQNLLLQRPLKIQSVERDDFAFFRHLFPRLFVYYPFDNIFVFIKFKHFEKKKR